jgi:hypothetical protein
VPPINESMSGGNPARFDVPLFKGVNPKAPAVKSLGLNLPYGLRIANRSAHPFQGLNHIFAAIAEAGDLSPNFPPVR